MLSSRRFLRHTMRYLRDSRSTIPVERYLRLTRLPCEGNVRSLSSLPDTKQITKGDKKEIVDQEILELKDKIMYSDYLNKRYPNVGYKRRALIRDKTMHTEQKRREDQQLGSIVYSVAFENMIKDPNHENPTAPIESKVDESTSLHMPFAVPDKYETVDINPTDLVDPDTNDGANGLSTKYTTLYEEYLKSIKNDKSSASPDSELQSSYQLADSVTRAPPDWMTDYEHYDDTLEANQWELNYGTPDPDSRISSVACGGCGAIMHCNDAHMPGYLPSEIYSDKSNNDLQSMVCQRCHFMTNYNASLAVNVSADEYPKLLSTMRNKRAAVILLVDLMDFPCSIWPDILKIVGTKRPVFVVGNKMDLLPKDSPKFVQHVTQCLRKAIEDRGISRANIKDVSLISAKTGYGIEDLISKLQGVWQYQGHVYLVGCTNSGKSTLFNTLLHSDYCKPSAVDRIQRATISPWPGTTLNLLKFPILKPSKQAVAERSIRLTEDMKMYHIVQKKREDSLNATGDLQYAELFGPVGRTFANKSEVTTSDMHSLTGTFDDDVKYGISIHHPRYKDARWCYDTPGVVQPDQVLHLLTTEELMMTLPNRIITPRTFCIKPKQTLFVAGLGRLDYLEGSPFIRMTVFASAALPVTVCWNNDASELYEKLLKTPAFSVPVNDPERLKLWPKLESKNFTVTGVGWDESAADIILSSAGWVAITPGPERRVTLRAWTPEGRGLYSRTPALLRKTVAMRGKKIRDSPNYTPGIPVYRRH